MKTITVDASVTYDIYIEPGLLDNAGAYIAGVVKGRSIAVVSDDNVYALYGRRLTASLTDAGFRAASFVFKNGEASKNAENYIALLSFLARERLTRSDAVVALGGGVVGDLAGFAAATYLRGVAFIQMPTTLLAAVDSSVGGKTGIDLDAGKNLAGTFTQPRLVLCDTSLLDTLPESVFTDGMAEVVKYGVIADSALFRLLHEPVKQNLDDIVARCVTIKRGVVVADEFEKGPRKLLNFGHTVGHAIELASGYTVPHGSAVAAGMAVIARAAVKMGLCAQDTARAVVDMLREHGLPVSAGYGAAELARAALGDKKRSGDSITLIIPEEIGRCVLRETPVAELERIIGLGLQ